MRRKLQAQALAGLAVLLGLCATAAHASASCNPASPAQDPGAALIALQAIELECQKDAPFLYTLGRLFNQQGRYDDAIDRLEGALLYRPNHWPTQLEYAIALEGVGDHTSALELLKGLLQNPAVDPDTRQQISTLAGQPGPASQTKGFGTYGLAAGFDDNLLGSTFHTELSLTTPGGLLPVQLSSDQRPQPGSFVRADLAYDGLLATANGAQWRYSLAGSYRNSPGHPQANIGQLNAALEYSTPGEPGPYLIAQHQTLQRGGNTAVRQNQLGVGYDFATQTKTHTPALCYQRLGAELHHLAYPANTAFNGRYTGLMAQTHCPGWGLHVQLRAGQDHPDQATRPGGTQQQYSLKVSQRSAIRAGQLALEWEAARQQDQTGYSPLLANNAPRTINRFAYRAEYRFMAGAFSPYIGVEWLDQRANLPLFELKNGVLTVGVRSNW